MNSVAPNAATGIFISAAPAKAMTVTAVTSVAAITAMPAPCGVGIRWEERAFGLASAIRTSSGRIAHVRTPDNSAAGTAAGSWKNTRQINTAAKTQIKSTSSMVLSA